MLEGLTPPKKIRPCKVRETIESLEPKDQEILKSAIADPAWQTLTLANSLKERGVSISESPLRSHRAGRCSCNA
jgi:transposase